MPLLETEFRPSEHASDSQGFFATKGSNSRCMCNSFVLFRAYVKFLPKNVLTSEVLDDADEEKKNLR